MILLIEINTGEPKELLSRQLGETLDLLRIESDGRRIPPPWDQINCIGLVFQAEIATLAQI